MNQNCQHFALFAFIGKAESPSVPRVVSGLSLVRHFALSSGYQTFLPPR